MKFFHLGYFWSPRIGNSQNEGNSTDLLGFACISSILRIFGLRRPNISEMKKNQQTLFPTIFLYVSRTRVSRVESLLRRSSRLFLRVHFSKKLVWFVDHPLYLASDSHGAVCDTMRSLKGHHGTHKRSFVQKTSFSSPFVSKTTSTGHTLFHNPYEQTARLCIPISEPQLPNFPNEPTLFQNKVLVGVQKPSTWGCVEGEYSALKFQSSRNASCVRLP